MGNHWLFFLSGYWAAARATDDFLPFPPRVFPSPFLRIWKRFFGRRSGHFSSKAG